jgi:hypothetical protein
MLGRVGLARRRAGHEAGPAGPVAARIAWEQARWIGEYLRGRYLLPPRSAMLTGLGPRRRTTPGGGAQAYLTALERERHAGRARAAAAGYPLPVPGTEAFVAGA